MEDLNRDATPPLKLMRSLVPTPCNTRSERPKRGRGGEVTLKWVPRVKNSGQQFAQVIGRVPVIDGWNPTLGKTESVCCERSE